MRARTFEVQIADCESTFVCKRIKWREFKVILASVEKIKESGMNTETAKLIDEAIAIGLESYSSPEIALEDLLEQDQIMELLAKMLAGGRVSGEERKKSE